MKPSVDEPTLWSRMRRWWLANIALMLFTAIFFLLGMYIAGGILSMVAALELAFGYSYEYTKLKQQTNSQ